MNKPVKSLVLALAALGLLVADFSPETLLGFGLVREAGAWIGRPLTPVSYAGVARRTTRRVAYAESAAVTTAAVASTAAAASYAPPPSSSGGGTVAIGTVVRALPSGCVPTAINGVEYYNCAAGVYYRAAFQGNSLVWVATKP